MSRAIYLSHPEVNIDPEVPVTQWGLNALGQDRVQALAQRLPQETLRIFSSDEVKAIETAQALADRLTTQVIVNPAMHENDRSSTGFLPGPEFEKMADLFFANPESSVRGWERAIDAQARIVSAVKAEVAAHPKEDLLFCGHGAVGTLLFCALSGKPIDRCWDQKRGGSWFSFDPISWTADCHWCPMESLFT